MKKFLLLWLCLLGIASSALAADYQLVTSNDQLSAGDQIIVAGQSGSSWYALKVNSPSTSNAASISVTNNIVTDPTGIAIYTLEATGNASYPWALKDNNKNQYIGNADTSNALQTSDTQKTGFCLKIDVTATKNVIISNNSSRNYFYLNGSGPFRFYNSSTSYNKIQLFKEVSTKAPAELAWSNTSANVTIGVDDASVLPTLSNPHALTVTYSTTDADVVAIDATTGEPTIGTKWGTATITATFAGDDTYQKLSVSYTVNAVNQGCMYDTLTPTLLNVSGTSYKTYTYTSLESGITYTAATSTANGNFRLNGSTVSVNGVSGSRSGLYVTNNVDSRVLHSMQIEYGSGTTYKLALYGSESPYTSAADLFGDNKGITLASGINTTMRVTPDELMNFVGLANTSGNVSEIKSVTFEWAEGTPRAKRPVISITVPDGVTTETVDGVTYYNDAVNINITTATDGAVVNYTVNGVAASEPLPFSIDGDATITAVAKADGMEPSFEASAQLKFRPAAPSIETVFNEAANSYTVSITDATSAATVTYSTDGGSTWLPYIEPLTITAYGTTTVKAKASKEGYGMESAEATASVKVRDPNTTHTFRLVTSADELKAGDLIIFTGEQGKYAMGNQNNSYRSQVAVTPSDDTMTITIEQDDDTPDAERVAFATLEASSTEGQWYFLIDNFSATTSNGYLSAKSGSSNDITVLSSPTANSSATIALDNSGSGSATVKFQGNYSKNLLQHNSSAKRFSCYSGEQAGLFIYKRVDAAVKERVARPVILGPDGEPLPEGVYAPEDVDYVTITCATEGATIKYTTDGTYPAANGTVYAGEQIPITTCTTICVYAVKEGMDDSLPYIATYHVYSPGKEFTRVTYAEMQNLRLNDEVLIVSTPDEIHWYAMGRVQHNDDPSLGDYREAVLITDADGDPVNLRAHDGFSSFPLSQTDVQPFILLSGTDQNDDDRYDWRLYASGSHLGANDGELLDGYLYSGGDNNSLKTFRMTDTAAPEMANTDCAFVENIWGGLTVRFDSPDGHEEGGTADVTYPKCLALAEIDGQMVFRTYRDAEISNNNGVHYVSVFKAYNASAVQPPVFTPEPGLYPYHVDVAMSCITPDAAIYYTIDNDDMSAATLWDGTAITFDTAGEHTLRAYATANGMTGQSAVQTGVYIVSIEEIFELLTADDELVENDRIIIVSNGKWNDSHYALGRDTDSNSRYLYAEAVEVLTDGTIHLNEAETTIPVIQLEVDRTGHEDAFLFNVNGEYLISKTGSEKSLLLSATISEDNYATVSITGSVSDYNRPGNQGSTGTVYNRANIRFTNNTQYPLMRFCFGAGSKPMFSCYAQENSSTYPISIYRSTSRIEQPTIRVVKPADAADDAVFNNAVTVRIANAPTCRNARLYYTIVDRASQEVIPGRGDYEYLPYTYGDNITVDAGQVIKAYAVLGDIESATTDAEYSFACQNPVLIPVSRDESGITNYVTVNVDITTDGARLIYTTDGTDPRQAESPGTVEPGDVLGPMTDGNTLWVVNTTAPTNTFYKDGEAKLSYPFVAAPVISFFDGDKEVDEHNGHVMLHIATDDGTGIIYYTLDGTLPIAGDAPVFTSDIELDRPCAVTAIAIRNDITTAPARKEFVRYALSMTDVHHEDFVANDTWPVRIDFGTAPTVTYAAPGRVYIKDADGRPGLILTDGSGVNPGASMTTGWIATRCSDENGIAHLLPAHNEEIAFDGGSVIEDYSAIKGNYPEYRALPEPEGKTFVDILGEVEQNAVIWLRGAVVMDKDTPGPEDTSSIFTIRFGGQSNAANNYAYHIRLQNRFGIQSLRALSSADPNRRGSYDILVVVGHESDTAAGPIKARADIGNGWANTVSSNTVFYPVTSTYNKDDTTWIDSIIPSSGADSPAIYYNMQGQRVSNPVAGEVYLKVTGTTAIKVRF